jgi:hypothetical protein
MPYNGSDGTFTLSDTVTAGEPNDPNEVNAIFQDLADGLTGAVAKNGQSTMTGALKIASGTAAAPGMVFGADTDTGIYRVDTNQLGIAVGGTLVATFSSTGLVVTGPLIPSGTVMLFVQTAAPTGWTKSEAHNDKALRIVSGAGGGTGGTVAFETAFASQGVAGTVGDTTLTTSQIPSHNHETIDPAYGYQPVYYQISGLSFSLTGGSNIGFSAVNTGYSGGGNSHTHTFSGTAIDMDVQYVDCIICTKD